MRGADKSFSDYIFASFTSLYTVLILNNIGVAVYEGESFQFYFLASAIVGLLFCLITAIVIVPVIWHVRRCQKESFLSYFILGLSIAFIFSVYMDNSAKQLPPGAPDPDFFDYFVIPTDLFFWRFFVLIPVPTVILTAIILRFFDIRRKKNNKISTASGE